MVKISPSILSSDYGNLESELKKMEECGADMIHVDVMDGHSYTLLCPPACLPICHAVNIPGL